MRKGVERIRWAPRVSQAKIRRLYETDALGIVDGELIDEVAYAFYARCKSILTVTEAVAGRVECPSCGRIILRKGGEEEILKCEDCSWEIIWGEYQKTYQHKQLFGSIVTDVFRSFMTRLPNARSPQEKMLLIDVLIHECHKSLPSPDGEVLYTRPVAVNLIQGNMTQIIAFLDDLAYGPESTPGARDRQDAWRRKVLSSIESREKWLPWESRGEAKFES